MSSFSGLPPTLVGAEGLSGSVVRAITALLENVGMLTGQRGRGEFAAILKSDVTVARPEAMTLRALSANGNGVSISGVAVPTLANYQALVVDCQKLAQDVASLRATVDTLVTQLKA